MNRHRISHPALRRDPEAPRRPATAHGQGFTLIELMITIAVAAVLLAIAIPNFRDLILRNELTTVTNDWVAAVNLARSEAVRRGVPVVVCGEGGNGTNALSSGCSDSLGELRAQPTGASNFTVIRAALDVPQGLVLDDTTSLMFTGSGVGRQPASSDLAPFTGLIADVHSPDLGGENHRCIRLISGTTVTTKSDTECN